MLLAATRGSWHRQGIFFLPKEEWRNLSFIKFLFNYLIGMPGWACPSIQLPSIRVLLLNALKGPCHQNTYEHDFSK